jgi:hypothetical protein
MHTDTLCFLTILGAVLAVTLLWLIVLDVGRIANAVERLARKDGER